MVKQIVRRRKTQIAAVTVSAGLFAGANAMSTFPGLDLTPEIWDFVYWAIGALLVGADKES